LMCVFVSFLGVCNFFGVVIVVDLVPFCTDKTASCMNMIVYL
jgi:hypothetical protein